MTPERFDSIEERTRKVEEAVIKLSVVAETFVKIESRVTRNEGEIDKLKTSIYQSCDSKTKEIDDKVASAISDVEGLLDKHFVWAVGLITGLFFLFLGGLTYLNNDISEVQVESTKNTTNVENIYRVLDKIDGKLDKLVSKG